MYTQFVCLSGLPRSGSTLLSAILSQNPLIHAEGNSAVCQLMWDTYNSCTINAKEQLAANNKQSIVGEFIKQIPDVYYKNKSATETIIVDKCRSWTIPSNIEILRKFIDANIKIIVLERSVLEVMASFVKLYSDNNVDGVSVQKRLLEYNSEPIMRSVVGLNWAKQNNQTNTFLFINYNELINQTESTIAKIYTFCGWTPFKHDFNNITIKYPENDEVYGIKGQHEIRPRVNKRQYTVSLTKETVDTCLMCDKLLSNTTLLPPGLCIPIPANGPTHIS